MYKMDGDAYIGHNDACFDCDKYKDKTCIYCTHLKNITGELNGRIIVLHCDKYIGPEDEEEISF